MDLMSSCTPRSVIIALWCEVTVLNRHRRAGLRTPICSTNVFSARSRLLSLGTLQGAPRPLY